MAGYCTSCGGTGFRKPSREHKTAALMQANSQHRELAEAATLALRELLDAMESPRSRKATVAWDKARALLASRESTI